MRMPPHHRHRSRPGRYVLVVAVVLQRGCLSALCIFLRVVANGYGMLHKQGGEGASGREGDLEGNKVEKAREEASSKSSRNRIKTEPRTGTKQSKPNAQAKKPMPNFGTNSRQDSQRALSPLAWSWADSAMRNFWPALNCSTHSRPHPLKSGLPLR